MSGDFKASDGESRLVRSDRTLYGAQVVHESMQQTAHGAPRLKFSAFAAQSDRLMQRDNLRGKGGSSYFLKRQDILAGTETLTVEWRDPVSGHVVRRQTLVAGTDYEIEYFVGVVILTRPLSGSAGGALLTDCPLGQYDVNLVAHYEYVPTTGDVDGISTGARLEGWVNDALRLGLSAQSETTGVADNRVVGADILLRRSDATWLSLDVARSEGPGFGASFSDNGGLDIDTTQTAWGIETEVEIRDRSALRLAYQNFKDAENKRRSDAKVALEYALSDQWTAEIGLAHTDRKYPLATPAVRSRKAPSFRSM